MNYRSTVEIKKKFWNFHLTYLSFIATERGFSGDFNGPNFVGTSPNGPACPTNGKCCFVLFLLSQFWKKKVQKVGSYLKQESNKNNNYLELNSKNFIFFLFKVKFWKYLSKQIFCAKTPVTFYLGQNVILRSKISPYSILNFFFKFTKLCRKYTWSVI